MQADSGFNRRLLIVDDEAIIRSLLSQKLNDLGFETHVAKNALEAKRIFNKVDPDGVLVDLDLGDGPSGVELIHVLSALNPAVGFVLLSRYSPTGREKRLGAKVTYLSKGDIDGIGKIASALDKVLTDSATPPALDVPSNPLSGLTKHQLEVLNLISKGLSNAAIAKERGITPRATEMTIHRIYGVLGLKDSDSQNARVTAARIFFQYQGLRADS